MEDSSSWVITLSTVVAMLHDWAKVKEKCSVMLPKRDNTMVGVSRQKVNPGGFQVVVMGEVPSEEMMWSWHGASQHPGQQLVVHDAGLGMGFTHPSLFSDGVGGRAHTGHGVVTVISNKGGVVWGSRCHDRHVEGVIPPLQVIPPRLHCVKVVGVYTISIDGLDSGESLVHPVAVEHGFY